MFISVVVRVGKQLKKSRVNKSIDITNVDEGIFYGRLLSAWCTADAVMAGDRGGSGGGKQW